MYIVVAVTNTLKNQRAPAGLKAIFIANTFSKTFVGNQIYTCHDLLKPVALGLKKSVEILVTSKKFRTTFCQWTFYFSRFFFGAFSNKYLTSQ